jgi:iron-sulfur cluster repair protein YtfE (RIC family)
VSAYIMKPSFGMEAAAARVHGAMTVNEIVHCYPETLPVFQATRIDTCCGGARRLDDVALRHGLELAVLLETLNRVAAGR